MYVPVVSGFGVAPPAEPFHVNKTGSVSYRVANDQFRSVFKSALVGWKVRSSSVSAYGHGPEVSAAYGHGPEPGDIEKERTETATMTPYTESTGPRDPGDGMRWVEYRRQLGRGIVVVPYESFSPDDDVLRRTTGTIHVFATEDFVAVRDYAAEGKPGFVLIEPAEGWKNTSGTGPFPGDGESMKTALVVAGVAVAVVGLGYLFWRRR